LVAEVRDFSVLRKLPPAGDNNWPSSIIEASPARNCFVFPASLRAP
jgi:hypothetical protein